MFNHPRDRNFNPNDNSRRAIAVARFVAWSMATHFVGVTAAVLVFRAAVRFGFGFSSVLFAVLVLALEVTALRLRLGPVWLVKWYRAFRWRRRWHRIWTSTGNARTDHTTVGLGLTPILGWFPKFKGDVVSWSIRPPSGHTLEHVAGLADVLAAHSEGVTLIEVLYNRPTDSKGRIQTVFGNSNPVKNPDWVVPQDAPFFAAGRDESGSVDLNRVVYREEYFNV